MRSVSAFMACIIDSDSASCVCVQVVMGGGQEAMEVTTTSTRIGKFEARLVYTHTLSPPLFLISHSVILPIKAL